jgi:hypothetical protein
VHLKDVLGQIKADCCNLHWVAPFLAVDNNCTKAYCDAGGAGAIHPIRFRESGQSEPKLRISRRQGAKLFGRLMRMDVMVFDVDDLDDAKRWIVT